MDCLEEMLKAQDIRRVTEAVILWTGYDTAIYPDRKDDRVRKRYGAEEAEGLLAIIHRLEDIFYQTDAAHTATDLCDRMTRAKADFCRRFPSLAGAIAECFAWCYSYDYK